MMDNRKIGSLLSICINHRNRSWLQVGDELRPLFRTGFDRLCEVLRGAGILAEILIVDWPDAASGELGLGNWSIDPQTGAPTGDPPPDWLQTDAAWLRLFRGEGRFTRGGGRNQAARKYARGDVLFFMDADMLVSPKTVERGLAVVGAGKAFFPFYRRRSRDGKRLDEGIGTGNSFMSARHFAECGGFPETPAWGGEDTAVCNWFTARGLCVRELVQDFIHQWHPKPPAGPEQSPGEREAKYAD